MKLTDLKPCAKCKGPLLNKGMGNWYVLRSSLAMVNPQAANEVLGLTQMLHSINLAEVMAPQAEEAVTIFGDKDNSMWEEIHLCFNCFYESIGKIYDNIRAEAKRESSQESGSGGIHLTASS